MALARLASGAVLGYEVHGAGRTVLLIAGLGRDRRMWDAQIPELARAFRVVAFDNRGVGESSGSLGVCTAALLAADAAGLLDHLGVERAHVVGASLGGLVAQELALSRPRRVGALALLCTHPGLPLAVPMSREALAAMVPLPGADPYERLLGALRLAFGTRYQDEHAAELAAAARERAGSMPAAGTWWAQAAAGASFGWAGRRIEAPTLLLTGDEDRIVPPENSEILARLIPGARLRVFPGGGHYFFQELPGAVNRALTDFLSAPRAANQKEETWLSRT